MRTILRNLKRIEEINNRKRADYTSTPEQEYENFQRANLIAEWFPKEHKAFAVLIGVKLARLGSMLTKFHNDKNYTPNNEGIDDTLMDNTTYMAIWWSYFEDIFMPGPKGPVSYTAPSGPHETKGAGESGTLVCSHLHLNKTGFCVMCDKHFTQQEMAVDYNYDSINFRYTRIRR